VPSSFQGTVPSTDGVAIAVHDLGGTGTPLLISHATGFHGRCYIPLADELAATFHSTAFDYRGHGDTPRPPGEIDWNRYGDDAVAMVAWLVERTGAPVDAFGHSMGGACLLMAAHRRPDLFRRLVVFEPIVFPPGGIGSAAAEDGENFESPMVVGARRRRATFPSYEAAIANFAAKPPLNAFTPAALDAYVRGGFAEDEGGEVHLKCRPDTEAGTFLTGGLHTTWQDLPAIDTDVLVIAGVLQPMQPSMVAAPVAERLPNGRYLQRDDLDHFGPMTHPDLIAGLIAAELSR
jgi:pimeloyl-ACP methyl ester carboxylesterase